ncbi:MAG: DUF2817 domain-containing protein [Anaerolineaceae bacterium]|nr:DUF2817 domain-containing protein [Anaerolineaceae bacterium]
MVAEDLPTLAPSLPPPPGYACHHSPDPDAALDCFFATCHAAADIPTDGHARLVTAAPSTDQAARDGAAHCRFFPRMTQASQLPALPQRRIPADNTFLIGQSAGGRDILGWRFGQGDKILLLVGGIHGGFEGNTVTLVNELIAHFENTPEDVLPGISIILIPTANPDGLALGRQTEGRFNANGVDLNRNWGCEWSPDAVWRDEQVDPGPHAFSEPETQALAAFIRQLQPSAAVFYHAAAEGVFAGDCEGGHGSDQLAAVIGEAAGYAYGEEFSAYPVTGTAASWIDGQGIPAVDLELSTTRSSEFDRNLRGVLAVEAWLSGR